MKLIKAILSVIFAAVVTANAGSVLCIGLNDYTTYTDLKHAENDAAQIAKMFEKLGHTVTLLTRDAVTTASVKQAVAQQPDFIYFAGHAETGRLILNDGEIALADIANANTMMVLDCCYVGRGLKSTGTMKILAASEYEAFESDDHGIFTKYLLSWMKDGKGFATAGMAAYLEKHIRAETGGWQKPVLGYI
ncbi:MAG: caspase family protein [Verrucomicrobia bacterium]|nr:caspase family protein [Verrucomicrobiota bacterium]